MAVEPIKIPIVIDAAGATEALAKMAEEMEHAGKKTGEAGKEAEKASVSWTELYAKLSLVKDVVGAVVSSIEQFGAAAAQGERDIAALQALGGAWDSVSEATRGTITAAEAYHAQQTLVRSGLRLSSDELTLITRYAREHGDVMKSAGERVQQFSEALREADAGGLRQFGITVQQGADRAHVFEGAMRQMQSATEGVAPAQRTLAEETTRFSSSLAEGASSAASLVANLTGLQGIMSSLSDGLQGVIRDMRDLNQLERDLPGNRTANATRNASLARFGEALRGANTAAAGAGVARSDLGLPDVSRLSDEQLAHVTSRLESLRGRLGTRETSTSDVTASIATADLGWGAERGLTGRAPSADFDAMASMAAGVRALRTGGAVGQNRTEVLAEMRALRDEIAQHTTEAERALADAAHPRPRDAAGQHAAAGGPAESDAQRAARYFTELRAANARATAAPGQLGSMLAGATQQREDADAKAAAEAEIARNRQGEIDRTAAGKRAGATDETIGSRFASQLRQYGDTTRHVRDQVVSAMSDMTEAVSAHFEAWVKGREGFAEAAKGMLSDFLGTVAKRASVSAAEEAAAALASLATGNLPGAGLHFAAAAGFGVVAGLAGLASQAVAPTPAAASGGAASGARSAADVTPRAAGKGSGDGQVVNVYFGGPVIGAGGARQAARQIASILNDGARQGDVRLAPNLLPMGT